MSAGERGARLPFEDSQTTAAASKVRLTRSRCPAVLSFGVVV